VDVIEFTQASSRALQRHRVAPGALWFGVLCGPLAGFLNEQIEYVLVAWSCGKWDPMTRVLLHLVPIVLIALCAWAAWISWAARTEPIDAGDEHETDADRSRRGFMSNMGVGLSLGGILVLIAMWLPVFYLNPCIYP
jgi:hypothetical protein